MIPRILGFFALILPFTLHADSAGLEVLAEINFARTQPQQYARIVATTSTAVRSSEGARAVAEAVSFLRGARPLPPLSWSAGISRAALLHARDIGPRGGRGHTGSDGTTPWRRMARFGERQGYAGENITYGTRDPRAIVVSLIVDQGVAGRGHRKNLFSRRFTVTGIAVAPHASQGTMCVMGFASRFVEAGTPRIVSQLGSRSHTAPILKSFF